MAKKLSVLFMFFICLAGMAQDDPYYEPVGKRSLEDLKFLPNLETSRNRVYVSTSGGVRFSNSKINQVNNYFENGRSTNMFWQAQLGYNLDDKWNIEFVFGKNPMYINTIFTGLPSRQSTFVVNKGESFNEIQLRIKRRIFSIDKVTQKTSLFFTSGLSYTPTLANQELGLSRYVTPIFNGRNIPPDTIFHEVKTMTDKHAFAMELGIELSGRISDQIGIGIYVKSFIRPKGSIFNELSYKVNRSESQLFSQISNPLNLNAGVVLYYNMLNWVKYRNKISLLN